MIPIKIGTKKYKIKAIHELTTSEFIEMDKIKDLMYDEETKLLSYDAIAKYISWQLGISFDEAFFIVADEKIKIAIGSYCEIQTMSRSKKFDYTKIIETVGQRHQIEKCKYEGYELLVFVLAVSQAASNNIDKVEELRLKYLDMPFAEVLPSAFFFFKILRGGRRKGMNLLNWLRCSIKIPNLRKRRGLIA